MVDDAIEETLERCGRPVLIIRGKRDRRVPHDWAVSLFGRAGNAELVEIEVGQHNLHYNYAAQLAKLCTDFINGWVIDGSIALVL